MFFALIIATVFADVNDHVLFAISKNVTNVTTGSENIIFFGDVQKISADFRSMNPDIGLFELHKGLYNVQFQLIPLVMASAYNYNIDVTLYVNIFGGGSFHRQMFHYETQKMDPNDFSGSASVYIPWESTVQIFVNVKCTKAFEGAIVLVEDRVMLRVYFVQ